MHPAPPFLETDRSELFRRIDDWPFALVIGVCEGRSHVAHTPVLRGDDATLRFHLARPNPACQAITRTCRALIVFSGPHDYISPDWYGIEDQVPTWNYLSVEAEGPAAALDDDGAAQLLDALSARFENSLAPKPAWTRQKMSPGKFERMLGGITAFTLSPERLEGITKVGQNKPADVRQSAGAGLKAAGGDPTISTMMERDQ
ncbi:FMN-binding negative transcriptional regulator [Henriciella sp.]|uniref:FMN-binding negative transcriptional regulator n=1 Tax=Henriciella sp. TaxID=1968823 RepID=UPI0026091436|nr:FMN-binding negative transcriptional regulator [Henriciella sp.]